MATHNGERYLPDLLTSLGKQRYLPDELVIFDDGSTDNTRKVIRDFTATAPFPVRLCADRGPVGFTNAFMSAAERCSGRLIAFCDQDDVWLPSKLERCAEAFHEPEVVLAMHSADVVDKDLVPLGRRFPSYQRSRVVDGLALAPWEVRPGFAMVFSAELVRLIDWRNRPQSQFEPRGSPQAHDQWILFLASVIGKVALVADSLCLYRQHTKNAYGAPEELIFSDRIKRAFSTGRKTYSWLAEVANERASFLGKVADKQTQHVQRRLRAGSSYYERLAQAYALRAQLYDADSRLTARSKRYFALLSKGSYHATRRRGFGLRALLKDGVVTLLGSPAN